MPTVGQPDLLNVDWSVLPVPADDGAAAHLEGMTIPAIAVATTDGTPGIFDGRCVVFAYPRTGRPGEPALVDDWDQLPGARGCTPQTCAFRDLFEDLRGAGAERVYGLSTQSSAYQREMVERLHVPFAVLSDQGLTLTRALRLPTFEVAGEVLIKRLAMVIDDGRIAKVWYPVFPPDRNAADVLGWLRANRR